MAKQELGKKQILVIEPDPLMYHQLIERLGLLLQNYNVFCVRSWSEASVYAKVIRQDIIVLGTIRNDEPTTIGRWVDRIALCCDEAKFVLFLAENMVPQNSCVKAIVRKPQIRTLAKAIDFLLSPTAIVAP